MADELLRRGSEVVVLDDRSGGFSDNVAAGARFVEGSIIDVELVESLFERERFDYVYHLAAYAAEGLSHFIKRFNYTEQRHRQREPDQRRGQPRASSCFVFTSSIAVYGPSQTCR